VYARRFPLGTGTISGADRFYRSTVRSVRALDDAVGILLDGLGTRADNTLVIYLSDNGYMFGEHRRVGKFDAYEEAVRVPMAVRYPILLDPVNARESDRLVANIDLAPTIAQAAGLRWVADGTSFLPLLDPVGAPIHDAVLIERCQGEHLLKEPCNSFTFENGVVYPPAFVGIVTPTHKYVEYANGAVQLFDLRTDPSEMVNLAGRPEVAGMQASLATRMHQMRADPPPESTIVTGPSGTVAKRTVGFSFFSQSRFSTYRCRLVRGTDPDPWHDCSTGVDVVGGLDDGSYVFEVAGTDERGITDLTPASRAFRVVTSSGPPVSVTAGPSGPQTSHEATFGFSSSVSVGGYECRLVPWGGLADWRSCDPATGAAYSAVGDGTWDFQVRAIDPVSGEWSDPPATRLLIVDDMGPTFAVWQRPPTTTAATDASFGVTPLETISGGLRCSVDGGATSDCSDGTFAVHELAPGLHTFSVDARDLLGSTRTTVLTWTVDRTPPVVAIVTKPKAFVASRAATFGFSSDETPGFFACSVDLFPEMPCSVSWTIGPFSNGSHTISVRALDRAGQRSAPALWTWTVDTVRPVVSLSGGPGEGSTTTSARASFSFTANEPVTFRCALDGSTSRICTSPRTYTGLAPGAHTFSVSATDRAGNVSVAKVRHWTVAA
jgi:hypothetical protein